jgi:hypothetical protein
VNGERDLWVSLPWATFVLVVSDGRIREAPPIAHWCEGKEASSIRAYWAGRGARIEEI